MNWLRKFMYGRNGVDALTFVLVILSAVLGLLTRIPKVGQLMWIAQLMVLAYTVFRVLSRNVDARRRENRLVSAVQGKFFNWRVRLEGDKAHKFFRCPGCHNNLRVPRGKGKVFITCPKCGERFQKKT